METPEIPSPQDIKVIEASQVRRARKRRSATDESGYSTEDIPNITTQQVKWIAARASLGSNVTACKQLGVDLIDVMAWFEDADFRALYDDMMENRREGFKALGSQTLPSVLLTLLDVLEHGEKDADRVKAATLLLRNQGLLMDKVQTVDQSALMLMLAELRTPRPVIKMLPSVTPNGPTKEDTN